MFAQDRYEAMWRPVARQGSPAWRGAAWSKRLRDGGRGCCPSFTAKAGREAGRSRLLRGAKAAVSGMTRSPPYTHPSFSSPPLLSRISLLLLASKHQLQKTNECLCSISSHSHLGVCLLPDRPRLAARQSPATAGHYLPPTQWQYLAHLSHPRSHLSRTFASIAHTPVPLLLSDACKFGCFGICFRWDEGWWYCWIRI